MAQSGLLERKKEEAIKYLELNFPRWTRGRLEEVGRGGHLEANISLKI